MQFEGMPRPKSEKETREASITIRVTSSLKSAAEAAAARDDRTVSQWIERLIKSALNTEQG